MTDVNTCVLTGRLSKDCENRMTQSGVTVTRFTIANNYYSSSQKKEEASFFDCVMFGKLASSLSPYLKKGTSVTISGELRQQRFVANNENRSKIEVLVDNIKLSGEKKADAPIQKPNPNPEGKPYEMDGKFFDSREELEAYKEQVFGKGPESFDDGDPFAKKEGKDEYDDIPF